MLEASCWKHHVGSTMLEALSLVIHPWQAGDGQAPVRPIIDGATRARLGMVRWLGRKERSWFEWLRGQRLEVLETDDGALLLTVVRPWGLAPRWEVYDAEERLVGMITYPALMDSERGRRGTFIRQGPGCGRIVGPDAQPLAEYAVGHDRATLLRFAPRLEPNPFLRMLLLGGVLAREEAPG
jgi:hypothetical protein